MPVSLAISRQRPFACLLTRAKLVPVMPKQAVLPSVITASGRPSPSMSRTMSIVPGL